MPSTPSSDDLDDQAIDWQTLLHSGEASARQRLEYQRWQQLSPAHKAAAQEAEALWGDIGLTATAEQHRARPRRRAFRWASGLAAGLVLAVLGYGGLTYMPHWSDTYHTGVGQRQQWLLSDGTRVTLNSASALSVDFTTTQRIIKLRKGEGLFELADDPSRPFVVEAGQDRVQAKDATFSVRRDADQTRVLVATGAAQVEHQAQTLELRPNQQAMYRAGQLVAERQQVDAHALTAWQRGKLIFNRKPLQDVLSELERYQYGRIVLPDTALGAMQISGVFDLNDPHNLLRTLEQRYGLNITYLPFVAWVH
ncbi:FecR family protein [Pseudomonas sp. 7P_10.2_Bac1]|uniref:FecR family protein n=1 Tax=Pseudomonas sp. 7P_10.2_Bac1 TaxID=2971614 RepID=UPI0021C97241|nr:FecR family protein [Pseudomonas sp. 7P_10.2_Bac1]MCU1726442.1 FecR family protein [Pseudomonas sp. 7P_10.2_Bac1]